MGSSWQASNPAQKFRAAFNERGIRIAPEGKEAGAWEWGLELSAWGREGAMRKAEPGRLHAGANRMDLDRGSVQEWFVNDERGLEQGFTIPAPPPGDGASVNLDLRLTTGLYPVFSADGRAVDFFDRDVHALRYAQLKVVDALEAEVPSRFTPIPGGIRIEIDDAQAIYPLSVDPLVSMGPSWTASGDQDQGYFGQSLAVAGDVNGDGYDDVIVGAPYQDPDGFECGMAHLFLGSPAGFSGSPIWSERGEEAYSHFGLSVATAGDVNGDGYADVLVGAPHFNGTGDSRGRAYLYLGSPAGLRASPAWTVTGDQDQAFFGGAVATAGDVNGDGYSDVVVGAAYYEWSGQDLGRAFLYVGSPAGLSTGAAWTKYGDAADARFGVSVATAGDVNGDGYSDVLVGADLHPAGGSQGTERGRAYLFMGSSAGLRDLADWTGSGNADWACFGFSVATAGDVNGDGYADVAIGAYRHPDIGTTRGRAYVYLGSAGGLSPAFSWTAAGDEDGAMFGVSVTSAGDLNGDGFADLFVGAWLHDAGGGVDADRGRAYVYLGSSAGLSSSYDWVDSGSEDGACFGQAVALAGDVNGDGYSDLIAGAPYESAGGLWRGRVYGYCGSADGLPLVASWTRTGSEDTAIYGCATASAGDVNGDGYSDVLVGAYLDDAGAGVDADRGRAYLYLGDAGGLRTAVEWAGYGTQDGARYGYAVASAGDVNGDGYSDFLVGAHGHDAGWGAGADMGQVYLYMGSTSSIPLAPAWTGSGDEEAAHYGFSTASAGDVNGDGYTDVLVGAYLHDAGGAVDADRGRAYLYLGSSAGLATSPAWTASGDANGAWFGFSVATAGDVNGDGYSDVVIGAPHHPGGGTERGRVYVYAGSPAGLSATPLWVSSGDQNQCDYGVQVATAGDVNGDGYADLVIGADQHDAGGATGSNRGRAYVHLGSEEGPLTTAFWSYSGLTDQEHLGRAVASAGDVEGDGFADVLVGSYRETSGWTEAGSVLMFRGWPGGLSLSWMATGDADFAFFGFSVSSAGDVNGDGHADAVVGVPYHPGGGSFRGRAYTYLGNAERGSGLPALARQIEVDQSGLISPLGLAYGEQCRLGMKLRSPFGRTLVSLEWQAVPLGVTFNPLYSPIRRSGSWWSSGLTGTNRTTVVDLMGPDAWGPWTWRVRTRYATATTPFQGHGPWVTLSANGLTETDLRTTTAEPPPPPPVCVLPDEPCWLYQVDKVGTDYTLNWQDPNQGDQRTGWNIRRSNDAGLPRSTWPLVGSNVVDMDAGTVNYQWTDHSGDDPAPSAVWYYQVTTYNASCPAEGPF